MFPTHSQVNPRQTGTHTAFASSSFTAQLPPSGVHILAILDTALTAVITDPLAGISNGYFLGLFICDFWHHLPSCPLLPSLHISDIPVPFPLPMLLMHCPPWTLGSS